MCGYCYTYAMRNYIYYMASGWIDHHNKLQTKTRINKCIKTHSWNKQFKFSILAMILADTYHVYKGT